MFGIIFQPSVSGQGCLAENAFFLIDLKRKRKLFLQSLIHCHSPHLPDYYIQNPPVHAWAAFPCSEPQVVLYTEQDKRLTYDYRYL
jgi:hypothetical protein